ncbi:AT08303p [Strongyloides ratti]|uniref:AT08303p n=1 Tax=Strongyloides ratti TaxID=34506 RepID=A0A090LK83_STRRB|nr:AT08303p [Strongyloides ratti]CEF67960.1 AT08303p [Strongyloides ratti]
MPCSTNYSKDASGIGNANISSGDNNTTPISAKSKTKIAFSSALLNTFSHKSILHSTSTNISYAKNTCDSKNVDENLLSIDKNNRVTLENYTNKTGLNTNLVMTNSSPKITSNESPKQYQYITKNDNYLRNTKSLHAIAEAIESTSSNTTSSSSLTISNPAKTLPISQSTNFQFLTSPPDSIPNRPSPYTATEANLKSQQKSYNTAPNSMGKLVNFRAPHSIPHVWVSKRYPTICSDTCEGCQKTLGFVSSWEKCKSCKKKAHTECKRRIGNNCGLTLEIFKAVFKELHITQGQERWDSYRASGGESSSSTNSTAPSTPAPNLINSVIPKQTGQVISSASLSNTSEHFTFHDPTTFSQTFPRSQNTEQSNLPINHHVPSIILTDTNVIGESINETGSSKNNTLTDKTLINNDNSINSYRVNNVTKKDIPIITTTSATLTGTNGTNDSEKTLKGVTFEDISNLEGLNFGGDENSDRQGIYYRLSFKTASMREKNQKKGKKIYENIPEDAESNINLDAIEVLELIGYGRFGEVRRGHYFGDVSIKLLNMDHVPEAKQYETFLLEADSFLKVRHENIVLFLGYTYEQGNLGIVMSDCKGKTLYQLIHESLPTECLEFSQIINFSLQICQGMTYLHTKGILHKDLRTKNIFIEKNNRIVITDFGLFNMARLRHPPRKNGFFVSENWLCYLAPELIKLITPSAKPIRFTEKSDVYAFGTCCFEMFFGRFPFSEYSWEVKMFFIGQGMKAPFCGNEVSREMKNILMNCWNYNPRNRPAFEDIFGNFGKLPKKKVMRSPSFPIQRSYESFF